MNRRRRSIKAETRLETLEGRITPTTMSMTHQIIGSQILVLTSGSEISRTGLTRAETAVLNKFEHIHSAMKAERFLDHHHNLKEWLERTSAPTPSGTTVPNNPSSTSTSNGGTTTSPSGTSSTTTNTPTTTPQGGTQSPTGDTGTNAPPSHTGPSPGNTGSPTGATSSPTGDTGSSTGTTNPPPSPSVGGSLDATLQGVYNTYKTGGISAVAAQYSNLATFSGNNVEVEIHGNGGDFSDLESNVTGLDPQISLTTESATYQWIDASVPITDLPALAQVNLVQSVTVQPPPHMN